MRQISIPQFDPGQEDEDGGERGKDPDGGDVEVGGVADALAAHHRAEALAAVRPPTLLRNPLLRRRHLGVSPEQRADKYLGREMIEIERLGE